MLKQLSFFFSCFTLLGFKKRRQKITSEIWSGMQNVFIAFYFYFYFLLHSSQSYLVPVLKIKHHQYKYLWVYEQSLLPSDFFFIWTFPGQSLVTIIFFFFLRVRDVVWWFLTFKKNWFFFPLSPISQFSLLPWEHAHLEPVNFFISIFTCAKQMHKQVQPITQLIIQERIKSQ